MGVYKGVISKNFKEKDAKYILGSSILAKYYGKNYYDYNTLESIWASLEDYFKNRDDMQEIVANLMDKLVHIFVFDLLIGQEDRHAENWGIVLYSNGNVDLQVNWDNSRALVDHPMMVKYQMSVNHDAKYSEDMIANFQTISSEEFSNILPNSLWAISEDNIRKIFERIESQTGTKMPDDLKKEYLVKFNIYYNFFEEFLDNQRVSR